MKLLFVRRRLLFSQLLVRLVNISCSGSSGSLRMLELWYGGTRLTRTSSAIFHSVEVLCELVL